MPFAEAEARRAAVAEVIGLAKWTQHGIRLTGESAVQLKWNEAGLDEAASITALPLGLRDGVTVVCRDERDFHAWVSARGEGASHGGVGGDGSGTGVSAGADAGKPWARRGGVARGTGTGGAVPSSAGARASGGVERSLRIGVNLRRAPAADNKPPSEPWPCPVCTFINPGTASMCEMCGSQAP